MTLQDLIDAFLNTGSMTLSTILPSSSTTLTSPTLLHKRDEQRDDPCDFVEVKGEEVKDVSNQEAELGNKKLEEGTGERDKKLY